MRTSHLIATTLALAFLAAGPTRAERVLAYDCQVQANQPDHGVTHWRRRILIQTPPGRQVRILDDFGSGWEQRATFPWVSAEGRRIILEAGAGKQSELDRSTGEYRLLNTARRFEIRGRCRPGSGAR